MESALLPILFVRPKVEASHNMRGNTGNNTFSSRSILHYVRASRDDGSGANRRSPSGSSESANPTRYHRNLILTLPAFAPHEQLTVFHSRLTGRLDESSAYIFAPAPYTISASIVTIAGTENVLRQLLLRHRLQIDSNLPSTCADRRGEPCDGHCALRIKLFNSEFASRVVIRSPFRTPHTRKASFRFRSASGKRSDMHERPQGQPENLRSLKPRSGSLGNSIAVHRWKTFRLHVIRAKQETHAQTKIQGARSCRQAECGRCFAHG